jgi:hypothetical protein
MALLGVVFLRAGEGSEDAQAPEPVTIQRHGAVAPERGADGAALRTLREWDRSRARAYATGSPARLRRLYVVGSAVGAADLRLLEAYRSRGLRVLGMRTQVLALVVLEALPDRWALRVTDRLARAVVVRSGRRLDLPRDRSSTRVITLMRGADARWRVSSVSDA